MIIAVDIDEVIGRYEKGLRHFLTEAYDVQPKQVKEFFPKAEDMKFSTWKYVGDDFIGAHGKAVAHGLYREMETYTNASAILWKLDRDNHRIRLIASRFIKHGQNHKVVANTAEWLDKQDIPYRDLLFINNQLAVEADLYIVHNPESIKKLKTANKKVIIFDHKQNRNIDHDLRAQSWKEIYTLIKTMN